MQKNKIDIILAHQQLAALPLIFARPFLKAKCFYIRHNADEDYKLFPKKSYLLNRFINYMMPSIIAPSDTVYKFMIEKEKVPVKKMWRINYGYNFSQYDKPDLQNAQMIRDKFSCHLLIISIARLVAVKRHQLMFEAVKNLKGKGMDVKMICLGDGMLKNNLQQWIDSNGLTSSIFLLGILPDIFDYLQAADILLHLSETEASNSVVKESGLIKRPIIVCKNVGDFSDYIINEKNSFLVDKENPLNETVMILEKYYYEKNALQEIGNNLQSIILKEFDINNVSPLYDKLINEY